MDWDSEFTAFVREQSDTLHRSAWLLVGDRERAADLVQETLVRLYPAWDKVLRADVPIAYVRRSMVNRFLSQVRTLRSGEVILADLPDRGRDDLALTRALDRELLAAPLATLSPRQRAAITLRYFDDLSDSDAAYAMGCPVVTLRSHLRRGLAALRNQLDRPPGQACPDSTLRSER